MKNNDSKFIQVLIIALLLASLPSAIGQVTFQQKQSVLINENSGPIISLKNLNSDAFTELGFENNLNQGLSMGITGSANTYFNGFPGTPYIFNGSTKDFKFWSVNGHEFDFNISYNDIVSIGDYGLKVNAGNALILESPNTNEKMTVNTDDNGILHIKRNNVLGPTALAIEDDHAFVGFNTAAPKANLHIVQSEFPNTIILGNPTSDSTGLRINDWSIFANSVGNLCFGNHAVLKSYIVNSTGNYVNTSDKRLKESIEPLGDVLPGVLSLKPSSYNYIGSGDPTIGLIAQEVEEVFPDLVYENGEYKALAYDNFAILAIKAIQEQQQIIEHLRQEVHTVSKTVIECHREINVLRAKILALPGTK